jgi:hypothetical protein
MTKRTTRTRAEAKKLMWEYYRKNKESLPSCINRLREEILDRLVAGHHVIQSFQDAVRRIQAN